MNKKEAKIISLDIALDMISDNLTVDADYLSDMYDDSEKEKIILQLRLLRESLTKRYNRISQEKIAGYIN